MTGEAQAVCAVLNRLVWKVAIPDTRDVTEAAEYLLAELRDGPACAVAFNIAWDRTAERFVAHAPSA